MEQHLASYTTPLRSYGYCYSRLTSVTNCLALLSLLFLFTGVSFAIGPYYVTEIGALPEGDGIGWARDVNSSGQVVGTSTTVNGEQAFLWQPDLPNGTTGRTVELTDLMDGGDSFAFALNDLGQVVGRSDTESGQRGFLWQPEFANSTSGSAYDLGDLPGGGDLSSASGINSSGQIVGYSQSGTGLRSFLWQPTAPNSITGSLVDLGDLPGGEDYSVAHDINDVGQVVGSSWTSNERHPYLWNPSISNGGVGVLYDLGDLPGGREEGAAIGINNPGEIVGHSSALTGFRGFFTKPDQLEPEVASLFDLGDLPGEQDYSLARDINNHGQVVGVGTDGGWRAVTWTDALDIVDLNDVIDPISGAAWTLNYASGINDAGQIVGYGTVNGNRRGFLLTPIPVPSPSTLSLVAIQTVMLSYCWPRSSRGRSH